MTQIYDEMRDAEGALRPHYRQFAAWLERTRPERIAQKRRQAEVSFHRVGITFAVYGEEAGGERLIPFDIAPRIIPAGEWKVLEAGLMQRVRALNMFLHDVYHERRILEYGKIPESLVVKNSQYRQQMVGVDLPHHVYAHIAGIDIVRAGEGEYYVLEDNLRVPSGVSYMLENRKMMMRLFPRLFAQHAVAPVEHYPDALLDTLQSVGPDALDEPTVAVLTPGSYNSAYFEHAFLAQQMGVELVEGQDLFVEDATVYMRTTHGPMQVHVIYRRIDDDYLDPNVFRPESVLGVPGLFSAVEAGRVTLANSFGTGVGDDKAIYPYVPEMIRFYLSEDPILLNVQTWWLSRDEDRKYVLDHLPELVVKEAQGAGGYGMLIGPVASKEEIENFRRQIEAEPQRYIAQPTLALSTCPTFVESGVAPRHIDLRPYVLSGAETRVVPGGLTRVALREGSLVVNSSRGGGTKDTWVLEA